MKNSLLVALSILLAVSCVSEVTDNYTNYIPRSVLLTANVDDSYSTKAGISEYGSFFWTENDQVAVYSNYNRFSIFRLKQGAGLSTAVFSGSMEDAEYPDRLAVFPSSIASSYDNDILKVVLPSSYEYRDDYALGTPPMLATISESDEMVFKHLCGMIRITLDQVPEMAAEIRLTSTGNQLSGEFDVSVKSDTPSIARNDSPTNNSVSISFPELNYPKTMTFSFPIPVGIFDEFSIEILDKNKNVLWSQKSSSRKTVRAGYLMSFDVISPSLKIVDLGLPSGTLWADRNVGANSPNDNGSLFAWGEINEKDDYTLDNYMFYTGIDKWKLRKYTKYNQSDNRTMLDSSDDVATKFFGQNWQMPTEEQMRELFDKCEKNETSSGYEFIGPNGNTLFLPFGGIKYDGCYYNGQGHYWTKTLDNMYYFATSLALYGYLQSGLYPSDRYHGLLVRPVYKGQNYFTLSQSSISLLQGESFQLNIISGSSSTTTWKSENQSVAEVSASGIVTGKAEGTTTIVATNGNKKQSCVVRVSTDISAYVTAEYSGGSMIIVDDLISYPSKLSFTLLNNWGRAIKITELKLTDGKTGKEYINALNAILPAKTPISYTITVDYNGIRKPSCTFLFNYEGKEYSASCEVQMP